MKWKWIPLRILSVTLMAFVLQSAYAQEIPTIKKIEITPETQPWQNPEAKLGPRNFGAKDLDGLLQELMTYNPQLRAVVEKILTLENLIDPAGALDDPRFSFEGSNIPISPPGPESYGDDRTSGLLSPKGPLAGKIKTQKENRLLKGPAGKTEILRTAQPVGSQV